jgi:hypothetical protein
MDKNIHKVIEKSVMDFSKGDISSERFFRDVREYPAWSIHSELIGMYRGGKISRNFFSDCWELIGGEK